jgi:hypothetical protein
MNDKQKELLEKMQKASPLDYFRFVDAFRRLYNMMCRECQVKTVQNKGNINPSDLCDLCKNRYAWTVKECDEILKKHGGALK